jgi:hypothetical protein
MACVLLYGARGVNRALSSFSCAFLIQELGTYNVNYLKCITLFTALHTRLSLAVNNSRL